MSLLDRQFRGYRIVDLIAEGGAATVYRAHQLSMHQDVALKVVCLRCDTQSFELRRLHDEGRIYVRLSSDPRIAHHLCKIWDAWVEDGFGFLAMELLTGHSLADELKHGLLPVDRSLEILHQILRVLVAAHKLRIIHRDVKPGNLFLCRDHDGSELVKVLDFGIAKISGREFTSRGGTEGYMAPEQGSDAGIVTEAADVFSCGVVLSEMIVGKRPRFDEKLQAYPSLRSAAIEVGREIPEWLDDLVASCLSVDPTRRPRDAQHLLAELERHRPATTPLPIRGTVTTTSAAASPGDTTEAVTPNLRSRPLPVAVAPARLPVDVVAPPEVALEISDDIVVKVEHSCLEIPPVDPGSFEETALLVSETAALDETIVLQEEEIRGCRESGFDEDSMELWEWEEDLPAAQEVLPAEAVSTAAIVWKMSSATCTALKMLPAGPSEVPLKLLPAGASEVPLKLLPAGPAPATTVTAATDERYRGAAALAAATSKPLATPPVAVLAEPVAPREGEKLSPASSHRRTRAPARLRQAALVATMFGAGVVVTRCASNRETRITPPGTEYSATATPKPSSPPPIAQPNDGAKPEKLSKPVSCDDDAPSKKEPAVASVKLPKSSLPSWLKIQPSTNPEEIRDPFIRCIQYLGMPSTIWEDCLQEHQLSPVGFIKNARTASGAGTLTDTPDHVRLSDDGPAVYFNCSLYKITCSEYYVLSDDERKARERMCLSAKASMCGRSSGWSLHRVVPPAVATDTARADPADAPLGSSRI